MIKVGHHECRGVDHRGRCRNSCRPRGRL